ncbi:hypothetical protein MUJ63_00845 [Lachnospiraceae bacterium NSJ-143]|nr:hypothetical protein [Lachnospiraceae bacterium NSJ-143]
MEDDIKENFKNKNIEERKKAFNKIINKIIQQELDNMFMFIENDMEM